MEKDNYDTTPSIIQLDSNEIKNAIRDYVIKNDLCHLNNRHIKLVITGNANNKRIVAIIRNSIPINGNT